MCLQLLATTTDMRRTKTLALLNRFVQAEFGLETIRTLQEEVCAEASVEIIKDAVRWDYSNAARQVWDTKKDGCNAVDLALRLAATSTEDDSKCRDAVAHIVFNMCRQLAFDRFFHPGGKLSKAKRGRFVWDDFCAKVAAAAAKRDITAQHLKTYCDVLAKAWQASLEAGVTTIGLYNALTWESLAEFALAPLSAQVAPPLSAPVAPSSPPQVAAAGLCSSPLPLLPSPGQEPVDDTFFSPHNSNHK